MATVFSDIATQAAFGNSLKVQRYHGGLATTLISGLTVANIGTASNVVYLCPIPWHSRIEDISVILSATGPATTAPIGTFSIRGMKGKIAKTTAERNALEYTEIVATASDVAKAAAAAGGTTKTLTGWTVTATNEIPLFPTVTLLSGASQGANVEHHLALPFDARAYTCAEAYAYQTGLSVGSNTQTGIVYAENALGEADKEHFGMLTLTCTTAASGTTTQNVIIKVTYVEPAPSSTALGKIARNTVS